MDRVVLDGKPTPTQIVNCCDLEAQLLQLEARIEIDVERLDANETWRRYVQVDATIALGHLALQTQREMCRAIVVFWGLPQPQEVMHLYRDSTSPTNDEIAVL